MSRERIDEASARMGQADDLARRLVAPLAFAAAAALVAVSAADLIMARAFYRGISGAPRIAEYAMTALVYFSSWLATLRGDQLRLSGMASDGVRGAKPCIEALGAGVDAALFIASLSLLAIGFAPGERFMGLPVQVFLAPMPLAFLGMAAVGAARLARGAKAAFWLVPAAVAALALGLGAASNLAMALGLTASRLGDAAYALGAFFSIAVIPLAVLFAVAAGFGLPLYQAIAGAAAVLFIASGSPVELIPSEAYSLFKNASMPAIPLFTIAGFLLSESGAGKRLVAVFKELFGWLPGGEAVAAVIVCAFFTTFTGANGVTILALGGVLAYVLSGSGSYSDSFSRGLLTASSSVGLLFPPSIAVILYAINAQFIIQGEGAFSISDLFLATIVPGILMATAMGGAGVVASLKAKARRRAFDPKAAGRALVGALPELLIPVFIALLYFSGFAGLTEIGALTIVYLLAVEGLGRRELDARTAYAAVAKALPVAGGALIIIAAARGLSFYVMDAGIPELFASWMASVVGSKALFLLVLNLSLLLVGCFMDVFSAVLVVSPLVIPLGAVYGVDPVHLGAIFIANLSIGFLTPPIGMNLFLASYAFDKPVLRIYRDVLPFFLLQLAVLALITWLPGLSLALVPR